MSHRTAAKTEARRRREEAEAAAVARDRRTRRLRLLGGVLAAAAVIVVAAIALGGGKGSASSRPAAATKSAGPIPGQRSSAALFAGIPQRGITLGRADAPVTLVEFADLQCPFCREYTLQTLPTLVRDYVRTGKVKMEFRNLWFIGDDSVTAGRAASAASAQNRLWTFADVFYNNQGQENTGYVTQPFMNRVSKAAGIDPARAAAYAKTDAAQAPLGAANTLADRYGVSSTPTILVGRGDNLTRVDAGPTETGAFRSAIEAALGSA
jgi:protein-disulfide isomerase